MKTPAQSRTTKYFSEIAPIINKMRSVGKTQQEIVDSLNQCRIRTLGGKCWSKYFLTEAVSTMRSLGFNSKLDREPQIKVVLSNEAEFDVLLAAAKILTKYNLELGGMRQFFE